MTPKKFKNSSDLGEFGEYIYIKICEKNNIIAERTNYCLHDILIIKDKKYYIDVKTSQSQKKIKWGGLRKQGIFYDFVCINLDNTISIYPDKDSPISSLTDLSAGCIKINQKTANKYYNDFRSFNSSHSRKKNNPDCIACLERELRTNYNHFLIRVLYRGEHKWKGYPDNIPGSKKIIDKYDYTIFCKTTCTHSHDKEIINQFFLIPHYLYKCDMNLTSMTPTKRQKNKSIDQILDWKYFNQKYNKLIFVSKKSLYEYIDKEKRKVIAL